MASLAVPPDVAAEQDPFCPVSGEEVHKHEQGNPPPQIVVPRKLGQGEDCGLRHQLTRMSILNPYSQVQLFSIRSQYALFLHSALSRDRIPDAFNY